MSRAIVVTTLFVTCIGTSTSQPVQGQTATLIGDAVRPPATFEQMVRGSDLIVSGRVTSAGRPRIVVSPGGVKYVARDHTLQIDAVLKGEAPSGGLRVSQTGGTLEERGKLVDTSYSAELLKQGEKVVLFLRLWPAEKSTVLAFGNASIFRVDAASRAAVPASIQGYDVFLGKKEVPLTDLLKGIRDVARSGN